MKITDNIHLIKCPHRTYFTSACLFNDDDLVLVDAGRVESPEQTIYPYIKAIGREPNEISVIILTHAHWDHCAGVAQIKKDAGCKVGVHNQGLPYLENPNLLNEEYEKKYPNLEQEPAPLFESVKTDFTFSDGDTIELGKRTLRILHTPGHSIDSSCIIDDSNGLYISGDSYQGRGEGRPLLFHDADHYMNSINRISDEKIQKMVTGHPFPPLNKGVLDRRETKHFLRDSAQSIKEIEELILNTLEKNQRKSYLTELIEHIVNVRLNTMICVLESLKNKGKIKKTIDEQGILWRIL